MGWWARYALPTLYPLVVRRQSNDVDWQHGPICREQPCPPVPEHLRRNRAPTERPRSRSSRRSLRRERQYRDRSGSRWPAESEEIPTMVDNVQWFVGVDWATQSHCVCLLDAEGRQVGQREFAHGGAGLTELRDWLLEKTKAAPGQIAVAIEMPHGPVVEMLLEHGFAVFAINPKQLDRFRDRFTVAGAKDDSRDALVLGDSLRTDRHAFRRLTVDDPLVIELREWSRMHDELKREQNRLTNRV